MLKKLERGYSDSHPCSILRHSLVERYLFRVGKFASGITSGAKYLRIMFYKYSPGFIGRVRH